ncbi:MAG TPA: hypothetical protein V6C91_06105 [Coleofasciculaceae cyanobacterium]
MPTIRVVFSRQRYFSIAVDLISWLTYYAFDCFNRYIQGIEAIFSQAQQWADTPKASPAWCPGKRLPFFPSDHRQSSSTFRDLRSYTVYSGYGTLRYTLSQPTDQGFALVLTFICIETVEQVFISEGVFI